MSPLARNRTARVGESDPKKARPVPEVGKIEFRLEGYDGVFDASFENPKRPGIGRDLATALVRNAGVRTYSWRTNRQFFYSVRRFFSFLEMLPELPDKASLRDVEADHFARFEAHLADSYPSNASVPDVQPSNVLSVLRQVRDGDLLSDSMRERSRFASLAPKRNGVVTPAYNDEQIHLIRSQASIELSENRKRISEGLAASSQGQEASTGDLESSEVELLRTIREEGPMSLGAWKQRTKSKSEEWNRFHSRLFASPDDLAPAIALLILETGLERQGLLDLKTTDFDSDRAFVGYQKYRAGLNDRKSLVVSDQGQLSGVGLLEALVEMTETSRKFVEGDYLLVVRGFRIGLVRMRGDQMVAALGRLGRRAGLTEPLTAKRLRKTSKQPRYKQARGDLGAFAVGHSTTVAGDRYVDHVEMATLHESSVEDALNQVVSDTLRASGSPRVQTVEIGRDEQQDHGSLQDAWFATCLEPRDSPYEEGDEICSVPLTGCLHCKNAVITPSKLPALRRLHGALMDKFQVTTSAEWIGKWGASFVRLEQILEELEAEVGSRTAGSQEWDFPLVRRAGAHV